MDMSYGQEGESDVLCIVFVCLPVYADTDLYMNVP